MSEPKINVPNEQALRDGVAHAELHLNQWDQGIWATGRNPKSCGTTACLAGHILLASGMSWDEVISISGVAIPRQALQVLGFDPSSDYEWGSGDAKRFVAKVFGYTLDESASWDDDSYRIAFGADKMKLLKDRITEITGIQF